MKLFGFRLFLCRQQAQLRRQPEPLGTPLPQNRPGDAERLADQIMKEALREDSLERAIRERFRTLQKQQ